MRIHNSINIPSTELRQQLLSNAAIELESYVIKDVATKTLYAPFCSVCDGCPDEPFWHVMLHVNDLARLCDSAKMRKLDLMELYPPDLLNQYTAKHPRLSEFVLSPSAFVNANNEICVCRNCEAELNENNRLRPRDQRPPKQSIANGYVIGQEPFELTCLNEVELALVSKARLYCQTWVFFGGCHKHIKGYSTFLKNHPESNVANLEQLQNNGLQGNLLVVLCGPFTSTQKATVLNKTQVNVTKVLNAWKWLKEHNFRYADLELPDPNSLPIPRIVYENVKMSESANVDIENEISITHVFPDVSLPGPSNGMFQTQDEFRKHIFGYNVGDWHMHMHARPSSEKYNDFEGDSIADAFVLQFPFGYTGLPKDPAVLKLSKRKRYPKAHTDRDRSGVYKKYFRHRRPIFHTPMFTLVIENLMLKNSIFKSAVIQCHVRQSDGRSLADKFGSMTPNQMELAIADSQSQYGLRSRNSAEHRFLRSITVVCQNLPHTNEATQEARKKYFSFLMKFGMPAIFLTVSPDDQRNYRIVVYALGKENYNPDNTVDVASLSDDAIIDNFQMRRDVRYDHPGICAEEYERIMKAMIRHMFNWNIVDQTSNGTGIFGDIVAWCVATEEQGRKSLHGHILIFVKNWPTVLGLLQKKHDSNFDLEPLKKNVLMYYASICSASLFGDFSVGRELAAHSVFEHTGCRRKRMFTGEQYQGVIEPVNKQCIRDMRHKKHCVSHGGVIATCTKCSTKFSIQGIIKFALEVHLGRSTGNQSKVSGIAHAVQNTTLGDDMEHSAASCEFTFPENKVKRLDYYCYENQKDFAWHLSTRDSKRTCLRRFAHNVQVNSHYPLHATRCFKKGQECFANLPESITSCDHLVYCMEPDYWHDFLGQEETRYMFTMQPKREIGDVFMNRNNPDITQLLGYNNNVICGISGRAALYVTSYNVKSQQKEEQFAFQTVAQVICKLLRKDQVSIDPLSDNHRMGFRRLLAGVYSHTGAHIVAAPMAHYLALNDSRFMFSHDTVHLPCYGLKQLLENKTAIMSYKMRKKKRYITHRGFDYLYRPVECEDECLYSFFEKYEVLSNKTQICESLPLLVSHPMADCNSVFVRKGVGAVPVFSWTWLGNTALFQSSLFDEPNESSADYASKEEYCFKFMILFLSFRSIDDLRSGGNYQSTFLQAFRGGKFKEDMLDVAKNIISLANSQSSQVPPNMVALETELSDSDGVEPEHDETIDIQVRHQLQEIIQYFASTSFKDVLTEEPTAFDIESKVYSELCCEGSPEFPDVIGSLFSGHSTTTGGLLVVGQMEPTPRFITGTSELNSLLFTRFQDGQFLANQPEQVLPGLMSDAVTSTLKADGNWKNIIKWANSCGLDEKQRICFHILTSTYVLSFMEEARSTLSGETEQLAFRENLTCLQTLSRQEHFLTASPLHMFITGPAGAGKSAILKEFLSYAQAYSLAIGHMFTQGTVRLTALTGAAACEVGGTTSHSEFHIPMHKNKKRVITNEHRRSFDDTRMIIIDEISFADADFMDALDHNLRELTEGRSVIFGKVPVVMLGDFRQLEPIGKQNLYKDRTCLPWWSGVNCMVELDGKWRFQDDPEYGRIMTELRNEGLSDENKSILNSRVLGNASFRDTEPLSIPNPNSIQYATCYNKTRDDINMHIFNRYLETFHKDATNDPNTIPLSGIVIKAGAKWAKNALDLCFGQRKVLFEKCRESDTRSDDSTKCDPILKLYKGCPVMVNQNKDVRNGIANGTTAKLDKIVLKPGVQLKPIQINGYWVNSVNAIEVDHIQLKWLGGRFEGYFRLEPHTKTFKVNFPLTFELKTIKKEVGIKLLQFPIAVNHATTVHKLQGKSLDDLVVMEWANKGMKNWFYVVLSRVRSLKGLFLASSVPNTLSYEPNDDYLDMMDYFRNKVLATEDQVADLMEQF